VGDFINELNQAQQEAVRNIDGQSLIIAGAGSGKTRVLTYRIAWILKQGIPASSILALTFTNKAAAEMKERISQLVGSKEARHLWMGTFHSVFSRILRLESAYTGYPSNYSIYDTADSRNAIKTIIRELKLDEQLYKPAEVFGRISSAKNNLLTANAYAASTRITEEDKSRRRPAMADIFRIYQSRCRQAGAMDFDDLLLNTNILFRDNPPVLEKYQNAFRYILVDEYQDTNYAQYLIISKLAARHGNISVVGDDAQSIYAFRGARIENILNFTKDWPGHRIFKLEQNYRSTKTIVNAANSLIAKNRDQISKKVWSANENGEKIRICECATDYEEGAAVAREIGRKTDQSGCSYAGFAVLYRTNAQSRIFEEAMRRQGIPYKVFGSLSFYQRKEIKDLLAYFRLTVNQSDQEALFRIVNYPARGIGKTTIDKITAFSNSKGISPWEVLVNLSGYQPGPGINRGTASKLEGFVRLIDGFAGRMENEDAWQTAMHIASASGILKDLFDPGSPENTAKYENIQELLNAVKEFSIGQTEQGEDASLGAFLQNVSLLTDADNEKPEDTERVTLMTIHSAKGLEFPHVFIGGLEEELFPSRFSAASRQELEEERRLFYVALTRACSTVTISYAQTRYRFGVPAMCRPSRFLMEIDPAFLEYPAGQGNGGSNRHYDVAGDDPYGSQGRTQRYSAGRAPSTGSTTPDRKTLSTNGSFKPAGFVRVERTSDARAGCEDLTGLKTGMMVEHERFGKGQVVGIEGEYPNSKATVNFTVTGRKQLLLKFAKLRIIS
jgi:DNA helicase II / ATP-dependent DNA helicase PcrA